MAGSILVKPGETITVVGIPADAPLPPYIPGPVDPGYSPPWAQVPPGGQGGGPVDPGYSPPWAHRYGRRVRAGRWYPGWGGSLPGGGGFPGQGGPVDPGYPPWANPGRSADRAAAGQAAECRGRRQLGLGWSPQQVAGSGSGCLARARRDRRVDIDAC